MFNSQFLLKSFENTTSEITNMKNVTNLKDFERYKI